MDLKSFIGQVVLDVSTGKRLVLKEITSPYLKVISERPEAHGYHSTYIYDTINGDPIRTGVLRFENSALTGLFQRAYAAYCHTQDAHYEEMGYWLRRS